MAGRAAVGLLTVCVVVVALFSGTAAAEMTARFDAASDAVFANPHDIELSKDGATLYVSDLGNNRIAVLDAMSLKVVGEIGKGEMRSPHDVHLSSDGRLYVADSGNDQASVYELAANGRSGKKVSAFRGPVNNPEGVTTFVDSLGTFRILMTGAWSGNVVAFINGRFADAAGGLNGPHDVVVGPPGAKTKSVWVADANNDRILKLTEDLEPDSQLAGPPFKFRGVRYLAFGQDGTLWAADKYTHRVMAIDVAARKPLLVLGDGKAGKGPGKFTTPEGVVVRGDRVWIADSGNNRIVRYRLTR